MNPLDRMLVFVRVAELSSFTQAADALGIPKAGASVAVQHLESQLGTRLLHRTTRRVQLTQDGQAYYERCKNLLADVDELQSMFQQQGGEALRGRVRIDMSTGVARRVVLPQLPGLLERPPPAWRSRSAAPTAAWTWCAKVSIAWYASAPWPSPAWWPGPWGCCAWSTAPARSTWRAPARRSPCRIWRTTT
ncbi:hypothetical protein AVHM3334_18295 [Acidovorax sp. SUPP3334]|nr:hypothetical protein AVHM3334_18295 [Acidovorax sp. SUPP3334]